MVAQDPNKLVTDSIAEEMMGLTQSGPGLLSKKIFGQSQSLVSLLKAPRFYGSITIA